MKRMTALLLSFVMFLSGCTPANQPTASTDDPPSVSQTDGLVWEDGAPSYDTLEDDSLLCYIESTVYSELVQTLDPELFYVEEVSTAFVSKEYLEEIEYNSKSNIFFGYSLEDLNAIFQGTKYVFTLDEGGQTGVQELVEIEDKTYEQIIKNVAIGTSVIFISVTVAMVTQNPAASAAAGSTVKIIFAASSMGAKAGTALALKSAGFGGTAAAIVEAVQTGDMHRVLDAGLLEASEKFKFGAIFGTAKGIIDGIRVVGNSRFFPDGSEQALKYPEGVEFTKGVDGNTYPRFEKWAKATAKFDTPTLEGVANHTVLSGNYYWDEKLANAQCGFSETPAGYVWHHVEDMKTIILIPQDVHAMHHKGGVSLIKDFLGSQ